MSSAELRSQDEHLLHSFEAPGTLEHLCKGQRLVEK